MGVYGTISKSGGVHDGTVVRTLDWLLRTGYTPQTSLRAFCLQFGFHVWV